MDDKPIWKQHLDLAATLITIAGGAAWFAARSRWVSFGVPAALIALYILVLWRARQLRVAHTLSDVSKEYNRDEADIAACVAEFDYLGVSGQTILQPLKRAIESRRNRPLHARLLLIHPDTPFVLQNARLSEPNAGPGDAQRLSETILAMAREFTSKNTGGHRVEVRFYRACLHYWAHYLDQREIIVGLRLVGATGDKPRALHLRNPKGDNQLYRIFREQFDELWNDKDTVVAADYLKSRSAQGAGA